MDVYILNKNFERIGIIDSYESLIWTERYIDCGDFELYINYDIDLFKSMTDGYYAYIETSSTLMVIENISTEQPTQDDSKKIVISGRCLKSLLYRRIIWGKKTFSENEYYELEAIVSSIINDAIISPIKTITKRVGTDQYEFDKVSANERKIPNFSFVTKNITNKKIKAMELENENLGETIMSLCTSKRVGIKIDAIFNSSFDFLRFECYLQDGIDRSYLQDTNSFVVFSPGFDNLSNVKFVQQSQDYKNVGIAMGKEGDAAGEVSRLIYVAGEANSTGIDRREVYIDCGGVSDRKTVWNPQTHTYEGGEAVANDKYMEYISEEANKQMKAYKYVNELEGEIIHDVMYKYGEDYSLGDIVQVDGGDGRTFRSRITEYIQCVDSNGFQSYPTFAIESEEEDEDE